LEQGREIAVELERENSGGEAAHREDAHPTERHDLFRVERAARITILDNALRATVASPAQSTLANRSVGAPIPGAISSIVVEVGSR